MGIEIYPIQGASTMRAAGEPAMTSEAVANAIEDVYNNAAMLGGRVIGAHALEVDEIISTGGSSEDDISTVPARTQYLFLVVDDPTKAS